MPTADPDSIRVAMDQAWRDHHHARDQTWKALQLEAVFAAGLVTVDSQVGNVGATIAAGALVVLATVFGVLISLHHRRLEQRKFTHILNCEEALGLHDDKLLPASTVKPPLPMRFRDAFNLRVNNTATFILRMHVAIALFAAIVVVARLAHTGR